MEHNIVDDDLTGLEKWYEEYMTQENPIATDYSRYPEPLETSAIEAQTLATMRAIDVTDGSCSVCHTMLDNWPDIRAREREAETGEAAGKNKPMIEPHTGATGFSSGDWIQGPDGLKYVFPCHGQTALLELAARKGCRCCGLILQTLKDNQWLPMYRRIEKRLHQLRKPSKFSIVIYQDEQSEYTLELGFPGRLFKECQPFVPVRLRTYYSTEASPVSQNSLMSLTHQWTSNCLEFHKKCKVEQLLCYPTRLLYIAEDPIRLVATEGWTDRPGYATLSHCWGDIYFYKLLSTNIEDLKQGIPSGLLTKTFANAVEISRAAGLEYLWIDSLCIIQEDKEDWEAEASRMASVYGGSNLNIAASSAKDGREGCFLKPRDHAYAFRARICISGDGAFHEFTTGNEYEKSVTQSHLATRAWTVQEKVLAPRTLHCGDQGFFWECRTLMASEYFPDGFSKDGPLSRLARSSVLYHELEAHIPRRHWRAIKRWYSGCNLTNSGDKLVALSGIARSIQGKNNDEYLAGLWRSTLEEELCWRATDPRERPSPYRAPSWSWAAVDGPVVSKLIRPGILDETLAELIEASVEPSGEDKFGAVKHGVLVLNCDVMVSGTIAAEDDAKAKRKSYESRHPVNPDGEKGICFSTLGQEDWVLPFLLDCAEQKDSRCGQTVHYLPLRAGGNEFSGDNGFPFDDERVFGLVLEEEHGASLQYKRIGCFEYSTSGSWAGDDDNKCSFPEDYEHFQKLCQDPCSSEDLEVEIV